MDLTKILSIAGKPGLHRMIAQTKTGMVVESLTDNHRFTAFAHQRISSLEEISVYSYADDVPLREVFKKIHDHLEGGPGPDPREDMSVLKEFFEAAFPEYDQERVYGSDIKKILTWYNLLQAQGMLEFDELAEDASEVDTAVPDQDTADSEGEKVLNEPEETETPD